MPYTTVIDIRKLETAANAAKIVGDGIQQPKSIVASGSSAVVVNAGPTMVEDKMQKFTTVSGTASATLNPASRADAKALIRPNTTARRVGKGVNGTGSYANDTQLSALVTFPIANGTHAAVNWGATLTNTSYDVIAICTDAGNVSTPYYVSVARTSATQFTPTLLKADGTAVAITQTFTGVTNVTGVTLSQEVATGCANGSYALAFTASGTLLGWGGGATQNVGAGGVFVLVGSGGDKVTATVVAGSLPGTNQTDAAVIVSGCPAFYFVGVRQA